MAPGAIGIGEVTGRGSADGEHELLATVGQAMLRSAPAAWTSLRLDVTAAANMVGTGLIIEQSDGGVDKSCGAGKVALDAVHRLRAAMYQVGKGTWYNATFVVDKTRQVHAEFDYENAPFGGMANDDDPDDEGDADPELLLEDHRMFPREAELLPEWHPARSASEK